MADPVASLALAIDAAIGWPPVLYRWIGHPVGLFARLIQWGERRWNQPWRGSAFRRAAGIVLVAALLLVAGGCAWALQGLLLGLAGGWGWLTVALLASPGLAQRSLYDHVRPSRRRSRRRTCRPRSRRSA